MSTPRFVYLGILSGAASFLMLTLAAWLASPAVEIASGGPTPSISAPASLGTNFQRNDSADVAGQAGVDGVAGNLCKINPLSGTPHQNADRAWSQMESYGELERERMKSKGANVVRFGYKIGSIRPWHTIRLEKEQGKTAVHITVVRRRKAFHRQLDAPAAEWDELIGCLDKGDFWRSSSPCADSSVSDRYFYMLEASVGGKYHWLIDDASSGDIEPRVLRVCGNRIEDKFSPFVKALQAQMDD